LGLTFSPAKFALDTNPEITADKITWILRQIKGPSTPYYLIGFENGQRKTNWASHVPDIKVAQKNTE
jgi:hypothetical protein